MQFELPHNAPLNNAILHRRYKRFLADIETNAGDVITIHCPNTGAMIGCAEPGSTIWYSTSSNKNRKYPHTWELTHTKSGEWICVNTGRANGLIEQAIHDGHITELNGYTTLQREVKYAENSRVDIKLSAGSAADAFVEVKSVTLCENGQGYFPDAVSTRGHKHLAALMAMRAKGYRAVLVYAVLHSAIQNVLPAVHIDPRYGELLAEAKASGVEIIEVFFKIDEKKIVCTGSNSQQRP